MSSPDSARLRTATTRAASSKVKIPATVAAAISPWEWPSTASGVIPAACHTAASDTITAHSAGWVTSAASSPGAPGTPAITSARSQPTCGASARPHSASRAANTGETAASSRPIPAHWLPWPGNTNTTRPAPPAVTTPDTTPGPGCPAATVASPPASSAGSAPVITARCSNTDRVAASDQATSAGSSPGNAARCAASRPAWAASPAGVRPDTTHGTRPAASTGTGRSAAEASAGSAGSASASSPSPAGPAAGASSRMMCALVPPMPNAETPARRGWPSVDQGMASVSSRTSPADQSMCGEGSSACNVRGSR